MHKTPYILSPMLRLVLLLLMLSAQGVASTHELCTDLVIDHHDCSICVLGHSLGTAVDVSSAVPLQLQNSAVQTLFYMPAHVSLPLGICYSSRAPPESRRSL